jgi:hypothetical protein
LKTLWEKEKALSFRHTSANGNGKFKSVMGSNTRLRDIASASLR